MSFCVNCGNEIPEGHKFCYNCGAPAGAMPIVGPNNVGTPNLLTQKYLDRIALIPVIFALISLAMPWISVLFVGSRSFFGLFFENYNDTYAGIGIVAIIALFIAGFFAVIPQHLVAIIFESILFIACIVFMAVFSQSNGLLKVEFEAGPWIFLIVCLSAIICSVWRMVASKRIVAQNSRSKSLFPAILDRLTLIPILFALLSFALPWGHGSGVFSAGDGVGLLLLLLMFVAIFFVAISKHLVTLILELVMVIGGIIALASVKDGPAIFLIGSLGALGVTIWRLIANKNKENRDMDLSTSVPEFSPMEPVHEEKRYSPAKPLNVSAPTNDPPSKPEPENSVDIKPQMQFLSDFVEEQSSSSKTPKIIASLVLIAVVISVIVVLPTKSESDNLISTKSESDKLIDSRDGKAYKIVKIGGNVWMAENLNYDYNYGSAKSVCYDNRPEFCEKYGRLYTWAAAMDSAGIFSVEGKRCGYNVTCRAHGIIRGVCPEGWHLPSQANLENLKMIAGQNAVDQLFAATTLKASTGWIDTHGVNANGTDALGFAALPAGYYFGNFNGFLSESEVAYFWSSTETSDGIPYHLGMGSAGTYSAVGFDENFGFSVRCVKDN